MELRVFVLRFKICIGGVTLEMGTGFLCFLILGQKILV